MADDLTKEQREAVLSELHVVIAMRAQCGIEILRTFERHLRDRGLCIRPISEPAPGVVNMILHCPKCGLQHVDAPDGEWTNPPHRSHLCHGCGCIWRPADVPTNGVKQIETEGRADDWKAPGDARQPAPGVGELVAALEFYANQTHWRCGRHPTNYPEASADAGTRARAALAAYRGQADG